MQQEKDGLHLSYINKLSAGHSGSPTPTALTSLKRLETFTLKCLSIGTPNITTFPFVPNGKWWLLDVPIFEYIIIRV